MDGKVGDEQVGSVKPWSLWEIPYGWLECNGQEVSRDDYSELFEKYRSQTYDGSSWEAQKTLLFRYGTGNGSTTFNLPDYRECALVGVGSNETFITQSTQNHEIHTLGQFIDDKMQKIWGTAEVHGAEDPVNFTGAFYFDSSVKHKYNTQDWISGGLAFDSSRVTRTGDVTHGKQIGAKYIIKVL